MNTLQFILILAAVIVVYDLIVFLFEGPDHTISVVLLNLSHKHPIVSFAAGLLMGHLFWSQ